MELQVRHLGKTFGSGQHSKEVLRDISFALRSGEFLSLVGSSGSGKSTILRLIAGLEQPSSGQV
ncbi:MAG TPA: nitrate ABC transporter ATP-binding protein, partial [Synechococcales bacterium UBA12195]|nr:nitrate ABC transporter ATP-binding protein [Synechococcales bacterium UBA12195]